MNTQQLTQKVTDMLLSFKMQSDIMGFEYLRSAIVMCYQDTNLTNNISKKVYPLVAEIYHSTPETVERGMRTAVENCFNSGGLLEINEVCGFIIYKNNFKWTNGELISTLTELLRLQELRSSIEKQFVKLKAE